MNFKRITRERNHIYNLDTLLLFELRNLTERQNELLENLTRGLGLKFPIDPLEAISDTNDNSGQRGCTTSSERKTG